MVRHPRYLGWGLRSLWLVTLLSLGFLLPHGAEISLAGFGYNLTWVTLGNIVGGALFVGMASWFAASKQMKPISMKNGNGEYSKIKPIPQREIEEVPEGIIKSTISGRCYEAVRGREVRRTRHACIWIILRQIYDRYSPPRIF